MTATKVFDVIIVGGGPAGLGAATGLARLLHSVVLFDSGVYRNRLSSHMHAVPTWDHRDPKDFRVAARTDLLARYNTTQFEDVEVESISRVEHGLFRAIDAKNREWLARKVILATGVRDVFPDIEGYEECWAKGIFHCLFCHGYEERGSPSAGVLAIGGTADPMRAMHVAHNATQLADAITIYTNGTPDLFDKISAAASEKAKLRVDDRKIRRFVKSPHEADVIIHFEDGTEVTEGFLAHGPKIELNGPFAEQLGCELTPMGDYKVNFPFNETSVHGVFAAGDCATPLKAVTMAIAQGGVAAPGAAAQLESEPWDPLVLEG